MQKQVNSFIIDCLLPYLYGYGKEYNTQQTLLPLIEKWENNLYNKAYGGAVLDIKTKIFQQGLDKRKSGKVRNKNYQV